MVRVKSCDFRVFFQKIVLLRGDRSELNGKKQQDYPTQNETRPGPDGPNASGWYGRLRGPISPFSLFNSDQL